MVRIFILFLLVSFGTAQALIFHVPDSVGSIQSAINISEDGDTIIVHPGIYQENISLNSRNLLITSLMFLDGDLAYIDSTVINGERGSNAITIRGDTDETIIEGLTLRNCRESGIYITDGANPLIRNIRITDNDNAAYGGGIFMLNNCDPTIRDCDISDNSGGFGGGISIRENCSPIIENCTITDNNSSDGGGIYSRSSSPTIRGCIIASNTAIHDGAGVNSLGSQTQLINCTITGNFAEGLGDGVYVWGISNVIVINSILWDNNESEIYFGFSDRNRVNVSYSNVMGGQDRIQGIHGDEVIWGRGNIDEDPQFTDPDNGDYSLQDESPSIDSGNPDLDPDPDFTIADMGAIFYPQQNIAVLPGTLVFNDQAPEDSLALTIQNIGLRTLNVTGQSISPDESPLGIGTGGGEFQLEPGESHVTWITLTLVKDEQFPDFLVHYEVVSNDRDEGVKQILITDEFVEVTPEAESYIPGVFQILSAYPNPFNSTSKISFEIRSAGIAIADIFDINGRLVGNLTNQIFSSGSHIIELDGSGLSGGVYFVSISSGSSSQFVKMVLMK